MHSPWQEALFGSLIIISSSVDLRQLQSCLRKHDCQVIRTLKDHKGNCSSATLEAPEATRPFPYKISVKRITTSLQTGSGTGAGDKGSHEFPLAKGSYAL